MGQTRRWSWWFGLVALWSVPGLIAMSGNYVISRVKGFEVSLLESVVLDLLPWQVWSVATAAIVVLWRRAPVRRVALAQTLGIHLAAMIVIAITDAAVRVALSFTAEMEWPDHFGLSDMLTVYVVRGWLINVVLYWGIVAVQAWLDARLRVRQSALERAQLEARLVEAHLDALKAQLQPHFLFNTLNAISVLVRKGDREGATSMLDGLSALLRRSLASMRVEFGTLKDELDFLRCYVDIETVRFADRLRVDIDVAEDSLDARVPNLILQPLVENAIKHGLSSRAEGGRVEIRAKVVDTTLVLSVADDGVGLSASAGDGVGLHHVRTRLAQLYPGRHRFDLASGPAGGVVATLEIPFCREPAA